MQKGPAAPGGVDLESITMSLYIQQIYRIYGPSPAKGHLPASKLTSVPNYHLSPDPKSRRAASIGATDLELIKSNRSWLLGIYPG